MKTFFIILITALHLNSFGQNKSYSWRDSFCEYTGDYDSTKVSESELKDTFVFCYDIQYLFPNIGRYGKLAAKRSNLINLENAYTAKIAKLKSYNLIKSPHWEEIRQNEISSLTEGYNFSLLLIKSFKHPEVLRNEFPSSDSCSWYIDALINGGSQLLEVWKQLVDSSCAYNQYPAKCYEDFSSKFSSSKKFEFARFDVTFSGWCNCRNHHGYSINKHYIDKEGEFRKEFTSLKLNCIE
jgi:hypothetical protein